MGFAVESLEAKPLEFEFLPVEDMEKPWDVTDEKSGQDPSDFLRLSLFATESLEGTLAQSPSR